MRVHRMTDHTTGNANCMMSQPDRLPDQSSTNATAPFTAFLQMASHQYSSTYPPGFGPGYVNGTYGQGSGLYAAGNGVPTGQNYSPASPAVEGSGLIHMLRTSSAPALGSIQAPIQDESSDTISAVPARRARPLPQELNHLSLGPAAITPHSLPYRRYIATQRESGDHRSARKTYLACSERDMELTIAPTAGMVRVFATGDTSDVAYFNSTQGETGTTGDNE